MVRKIIQIEEALCNGCSLCIDACHEGALQLVDGKAKLISDSYCDGLGDCLPECPTGAIQIVQREAADYDEETVKARMAEKKGGTLACGCPSAAVKTVGRPREAAAPEDVPTTYPRELHSELRSWPLQIKLVPVNAPYFDGAHLLIAADCTAFAYGDFHRRFMRNKIALIGCPKLDNEDYAHKLTDILTHNDIRSVTILRMEVPCCAGIVEAAKEALQRCGKMIPWGYHIISTEGELLEA